jgi:hypothetical protein
MKHRFPVVLGVLLGMSQSLLCGGEPRQLQLKWNELGPRIENRKVALVLAGGTYIEGKVQRVVPDGLWLRISKTSDHMAQPKGSHLIPRQSVSMLQVTEYRKLARLLVTAGAVAAVAGIAAANYPDLYEGPAVVAVPAVTAAGVIGGAVAGYYAGKRLDKRVVEIRIAAEGQSGGRPAVHAQKQLTVRLRVSSQQSSSTRWQHSGIH